MRTSCDMNTPSPSPSGFGLSLPELSRITVRLDPPITKPKNWFCEELSSTNRLSRTRKAPTPIPKPRTEPPRIVTPL